MTVEDDFKKFYFECKELELEKLLLRDKKDELDLKVSISKAVVDLKENLTIKYPLIFGSVKCRISVLNIGMVKSARKIYLGRNDKEINNYEMSFNREIGDNDDFFYLLNEFQSKRKISIDDKSMMVTCSVVNYTPKITGENKKEWKGVDFYENFLRDVDFVDETNWPEFFGISNRKYKEIVSMQIDSQ